MSEYERAIRNRVYQKLQPFLRSGNGKLRPDGQIEVSGGMNPDTPWLFARHTETKNCHLWHHVMFKIFGFLPSKCLNCYKVVAEPLNVVQLFKMHELQKMLNYPSKCGIEIREYTNKNYGGYWYNDSLAEGYEKYKIVRKAIDDNISKDIPLVLKRGCSEFELQFGPNSEWEKLITQQQLETEKILTSIFVYNKEYPAYREEYVDNIKAKWVEFAHDRKDQAYLELTGGKRLYPKFSFYHEVLSKAEEEGNLDKAVQEMEKYKESNKNIR